MTRAAAVERARERPTSPGCCRVVEIGFRVDLGDQDARHVASETPRGDAVGPDEERRPQALASRGICAADPKVTGGSRRGHHSYQNRTADGEAQGRFEAKREEVLAALGAVELPEGLLSFVRENWSRRSQTTSTVAFAPSSRSYLLEYAISSSRRTMIRLRWS